MRFSKKFKASAHCLPSPDGTLIATLLPTGIYIRKIDDLNDTAHVVALPDDLASGPIVKFQWAPSSRRLLVSAADRILVVAALPDSEGTDHLGQPRPPFRATIKNPVVPVVGKPAFVGFGPVDDQVYVCSAFGIKFAVFDLHTAKTVEIANPKLYTPASICSRGYSVRPESHHLAILTRTNGKDWISVHHPTSAAPVMSWSPDVVDAQGLAWSPDGRWLVTWESPSYGHKILFYTPDGHLFKTWNGPGATTSVANHGAADDGDDNVAGMTATASITTLDESIGPGVRATQFTLDGRLLAVGDYTRSIHFIDMTPIVEAKRLIHPITILPRANASLKVWQEQIDLTALPAPANAAHTFIEAVQTVSPPGRPSTTGIDSAAAASGCSLLTFDSSSTFLASRLEESPSTIWIWSLEDWQLRTVLMFHASVSTVVWHPTAPHTLLITCEGEQHHGLGFVWNSLYGPPVVANFAMYFPSLPTAGQTIGLSSSKRRPTWLNLDSQPPTLFYSDGTEFALASSSEDSLDDQMAFPLPWPEASDTVGSSLIGIPGREDESWQEESTLELVPATLDTEGVSELDDTFYHKREE